MDNHKILLIEDSELDAELAVEVLLNSGYKKSDIDCTKDLQEAKNKIESNEYSYSNKRL